MRSRSTRTMCRRCGTESPSPTRLDSSPTPRLSAPLLTCPGGSALAEVQVQALLAQVWGAVVSVAQVRLAAAAAAAGAAVVAGREQQWTR